MIEHIDCSSIGECAAQAMQDVADEHDREGNRVRTVAIVVEVDRGEDTTLLIRSTEDRRWTLTAFLATAADWLENGPPAPLETHESGDDE